MAVVCVYRSPSMSGLTGLETFVRLLLKLSLSAHHIILDGDINIDLIKESYINSQYCDILSDFVLVQLIDDPTRVYYSH